MTTSIRGGGRESLTFTSRTRIGELRSPSPELSWDVGKRIMLVVVGAGIGSLAGLLASFLGMGNWALIAGAVAGGLIPPLVLGPPSRPPQ